MCVLLDPRSIHKGVTITCHLNPPRTNASEIAVDLRQNANMTFSRKVPCTALLKIHEQILRVFLGARHVDPTLARFPHLDLFRYTYVHNSKIYHFTELTAPLAALLWFWQNALPERHATPCDGQDGADSRSRGEPGQLINE
jgi:hypothetical protein